jgi:hypothetical protein
MVLAQTTATSKETEFSNVSEPAFMGSPEYANFSEFFQDNLRIPLNGQNWGVVGPVVVQFNVSLTGNLSEIQVIDSVRLNSIIL